VTKVISRTNAGKLRAALAQGISDLKGMAGVLAIKCRFPFQWVASLVVVVPAIAHSQTTQAPGWGQSVTNGSQLLDQGQQLFMVAAAFIGVVALLYAGVLFKKRASQNGQQEVKTSHIFYAIGAGIFLLSISLIVRNSITTLGGTSTDVGRRAVYNGQGF
jgi:hypothetical protein